MESDTFGAAAKREIVRKIGAKVVLESYMRKKEHVERRTPRARPNTMSIVQQPEYEIVNGTSVSLEHMHARVSINDMYIIWSITWKTLRGAGDLGTTWANYSDHRSEEDKKAKAL